jgi:predicted DNA binding CopG/RHH family protein
MARKKIPNFATEAEEQEFWQKNDSTGLVNWSSGRIGLFPDLKPSTKTISLRLPESLIAALKVIANKRDVPYQSLMKVFLAERLQEELGDLDNKPVERTPRRGRTQ